MANYAITDLHGMWNLWEQVKNYCKSDDVIYFLGDAADRGRDGIKIIKDLLNDKRVVYLKGNHEDMFVTVGQEILDGHFEQLSWWIANGGHPTFTEFQTLPIQEQEWLIKKLNSLPDHKCIKNTKEQNIFLSHAGTALDYNMAEFVLIKGGNPYLWDRRHFWKDWPQSESYSNWYIVHGHTPCQHLIKELNQINMLEEKALITNLNLEIIEYANGHKFDLDLASFLSNKIALFNLDELKVEKYFFTEEK